MRTTRSATLVTLSIMACATASAFAQQAGPLPVGSAAPDFALAGATRDGTLKSPVHLHDFKDQTVVIAFFYQARTKG